MSSEELQKNELAFGIVDFLRKACKKLNSTDIEAEFKKLDLNVLRGLNKTKDPITKKIDARARLTRIKVKDEPLMSTRQEDFHRFY